MPRRALILVLAALIWASRAQAQETAVDLELILAVDVSRSMDLDEQALQRQGYVAALTHPDVVGAITQGRRGRIALTYIEWAGAAIQYKVVDWQMIDGLAAAESFAARLAQAPIQRFRGTSISNSLAFVAPEFDRNAFKAPRRVIDVSGDGPNNMGIPVEVARAAVLDLGITINGLPIMIKQPGGFAAIADLDAYYQACVIGGFGAFVVVVRAPDQFAEAIRRKLVLEIAGAEPPATPTLIPAAAGDTHIDCLIGEKLRQQWDRQ